MNALLSVLGVGCFIFMAWMIYVTAVYTQSIPAWLAGALCSLCMLGAAILAVTAVGLP
jgi:hypothetical protein